MQHFYIRRFDRDQQSVIKPGRYRYHLKIQALFMLTLISLILTNELFMKKILTSAGVVTAFLMTLTASADVTTGCRFKQQDIERDLEHARQYNNTSRVNGLEKALQENREHCNDATLLHERQLRVEEKKQNWPIVSRHFLRQNRRAEPGN